MADRDYSRIPAINRRVHQEVIDAVSHVFENDHGVVRDEENGIAIDVSFMRLLQGLEYDGGDGACTVGATYKQIYKIGHQVGFGRRQMNLWVGFCGQLPLSQKMAGHLISNLLDRERETAEVKRLINEAVEAEDGAFDVIDNLVDPNNITFKGDQITPDMAAILSILINLRGEEDFVAKEGIASKMEDIYGGSPHATNGLLYQLRKRGYVEERRGKDGWNIGNPETSTCSSSYRLTGEFRRFPEKHNLHALVRQDLRS